MLACKMMGQGSINNETEISYGGRNLRAAGTLPGDPGSRRGKFKYAVKETAQKIIRRRYDNGY